MTRQIPATITWLIIGLVVTASLVVALLIGSDPTASAATKKTPTIGSSCAHPWKMTFNPSKIDPVYNKGAIKVIGHKVKGEPGPNQTNLVHATAFLKRSGYRVCHFTGRLGKPATELTCNHGRFSHSGWDLTNSTGGTCDLSYHLALGEDSGSMVVTITAARKRSS